MDRILVSGTEDLGSTPSGSASLKAAVSLIIKLHQAFFRKTQDFLEKVWKVRKALKIIFN